MQVELGELLFSPVALVKLPLTFTHGAHFSMTSLAFKSHFYISKQHEKNGSITELLVRESRVLPNRQRSFCYSIHNI